MTWRLPFQHIAAQWSDTIRGDASLGAVSSTSLLSGQMPSAAGDGVMGAGAAAGVAAGADVGAAALGATAMATARRDDDDSSAGSSS